MTTQLPPSPLLLLLINLNQLVVDVESVHPVSLELLVQTEKMVKMELRVPQAKTDLQALHPNRPVQLLTHAKTALLHQPVHQETLVQKVLQVKLELQENQLMGESADLLAHQVLPVLPDKKDSQDKRVPQVLLVRSTQFKVSLAQLDLQAFLDQPVPMARLELQAKTASLEMKERPVMLAKPVRQAKLEHQVQVVHWEFKVLPVPVITALLRELRPVIRFLFRIFPIIIFKNAIVKIVFGLLLYSKVDIVNCLFSRI